MMEWTTPKTDWKPADAFLLCPDYARIRGNILYLRRRARRFYPDPALADMALYSIADIPGAEFFARVDGNVDALLDGTFRPPHTERARAYRADGRVWNADELNRIESALGALHAVLAAQENTRPTLAFSMGGDLLGAYV